MSVLLAVAPALPLDEAGKYVAGAFVVFVGVVVLYVAIMGVRLQRMSRELTELHRALEAREQGEAARAGAPEAAQR
ncbi:MAG TPA: hypothetical protein VF250_04925 [Conexibacter sp.]